MDYNIFPKSGNRINGGVIGIILVVILLAILVNVKPNYFKYLFKSFLCFISFKYPTVVLFFLFGNCTKNMVSRWSW